MSKQYRKENKKFYLSVEGDCEYWYFMHLQKLINECPDSKYNAKFLICKKVSPTGMLKRNAGKSTDTYKGKELPYFHIQDIEDYQDDEHRKNFENLIDDLRDAKKIFGVNYLLGYSNFSFELWLLMHVCNMSKQYTNRKQYLSEINKNFHRDFQNINEYKKESEFQSIIDDYVTISSVRQAISRAEKLRGRKSEVEKMREYKGIKFFPDNPDTTVDMVVKLILEVCLGENSI